MKSIFLISVVFFAYSSVVLANSTTGGYNDGCHSGKITTGVISGKYKKDEYEYDHNDLYRMSWDKGFLACAKEMSMSKDIQEALSLARLQTYTDNMELISYFNRKGYKAFAINPSNTKNFWWAHGYNSKNKVIKHVMKKCGRKCELFAIGNRIIYNN